MNMEYKKKVKFKFEKKTFEIYGEIYTNKKKTWMMLTISSLNDSYQANFLPVYDQMTS